MSFASDFHDLRKRTRLGRRKKGRNGPILPNKVEKGLNLQRMEGNKVKLKLWTTTKFRALKVSCATKESREWQSIILEVVRDHEVQKRHS